MIPKIKKVLYATDLSESAKHAFGYAIAVARSNEAKISIINVHEKLSHNVNIQMRSEEFSAAKEKLTEKIRSKLEVYGKNENLDECLFAKLVGNIYVTSGFPVEKIINQAKAGDYDLIVMGTHGHGFLYSSLIGSTAQKMVQQSDIPVMVVRLQD
ncbi:MAG: universal stress protein [Desulfuromonadales bacterium]|nr:universal stress protein [Desulfuromonadales bacterium]NIS39211.1 universal stress protein [Desulfuromonadales bacterium]